MTSETTEITTKKVTKNLNFWLLDASGHFNTERDGYERNWRYKRTVIRFEKIIRTIS